MSSNLALARLALLPLRYRLKEYKQAQQCFLSHIRDLMMSDLSRKLNVL